MTANEIPVLTAQQVREIDRIAIQEVGIPGLVLMENAGRGVADHIRARGIRRALICCGAGNNGGDGFVIARHLDRHRIDVHVLVACDPLKLKGDAAANFGWLVATHATVHHVGNVMPHQVLVDAGPNDCVVDALLGTGSRGAPRAPLDEVIRQLNAMPAFKLAVDLPSGLDGETGAAAQPTFRAQETATFVAAKPGLVADQAREWVGKLSVHDIGVPRRVLARFGVVT